MQDGEMPNMFCCLCLFPFCLGMLIKLVMGMLGLWWGCAPVLFGGCTHWNRAPLATSAFVTCEKLSCSVRTIEDKLHYSRLFSLLELFGISASVVSVLAKCRRSFSLLFIPVEETRAFCVLVLEQACSCSFETKLITCDVVQTASRNMLHKWQVRIPFLQCWCFVFVRQHRT